MRPFEDVARRICAIRGLDPDEVITVSRPVWDEDSHRTERTVRAPRWTTMLDAARSLSTTPTEEAPHDR